MIEAKGTSIEKQLRNVVASGPVGYPTLCTSLWREYIQGQHHPLRLAIIIIIVTIYVLLAAASPSCNLQ